MRLPLHAFTVFAGALLLLIVQPMVGKRLLPWFGGSPAVWSACLLFFQSLVLLGYALADQLVRRAGPRAQLLAAFGLVTAACVALPIGPGPGDRPDALAQPVTQLLLLLAGHVGLPCLALATAAPLVQHWYHHSAGGRSPYALYAASNAGSLLGLLSYPFAVEPRLALGRQTGLWSLGFALFALGLIASGVLAALRARAERPEPGAHSVGSSPASPVPPLALRARWFALAALPSALLLAGTNQITLDLAAGPLLWVLPLALYLLSFVVAFARPELCSRRLLLPAWTLATAALGVAAFTEGGGSVLHALAAILAGSLLCHCELARARPEPAHLSRFYLALAAGGAAGSLFVALLAPRVFSGFAELPLAVIGIYALALVLVRDERDPVRRRAERRWIGFGLGLTFALFLSTAWAEASGRSQAGELVEQQRGFFGVLRVTRLREAVVLTHGRIKHGMQFRDRARRNEPTLYYTRASAAGRALQLHAADRPRSIGVVGLGAGTLASYGRANDRLRFYEIDPIVIDLARRRFEFLRASQAAIEIVTADARVALEREPGQRFDLLLIDAFSSDAVPAHLLTVEAFAVYLRHLRSDGLLLVHIANRHVDLQRVVTGAALRHHLALRVVDTPSDVASGAARTRWAVLARDLGALDRALGGAPALARSSPVVWTDDFSDLLRVLRW